MSLNFHNLHNCRSVNNALRLDLRGYNFHLVSMFAQRRTNQDQREVKSEQTSFKLLHFVRTQGVRDSHRLCSIVDNNNIRIYFSLLECIFDGFDSCVNLSILLQQSFTFVQSVTWKLYRSHYAFRNYMLFILLIKIINMMLFRVIYEVNCVVVKPF